MPLVRAGRVAVLAGVLLGLAAGEGRAQSSLPQVGSDPRVSIPTPPVSGTDDSSVDVIITLDPRFADPVPSLLPGGGGGGAVVLSDVELDTVRAGSNSDSKYRLRSKSVDYRTETSDDSDSDDDTYKVTDKSRFKMKGEDSSSDYSTKTKEVRRENAPAGSKLNTGSVDYYTETREEYDPATESWNTVEGDTYKATTRSSYQDTRKGPRSSYSTTTKVVKNR